jgi:hypothetical protein
VAHFYTNELRYYRTDGASPYEEGSIDLGEVTHDLALDHKNDLLFVVSDVAQTVRVYKLARPAGVGQPITAPALQATINTDATKMPVFAKVNPQTQRLYVVITEKSGGLVTNYDLAAYDVSDPSNPTAISGSPYTIPTTHSLALDWGRNVLFLVHNTTNELHGYDLHGDGFAPIPGGPLALKTLFPQENQFVLTVRNLKADPYQNRLFAARAQSALSELIVLEYPATMPTASQGYGAAASMSQITVVADPFDVDTPSDQRPNLLDAYEPAVDLQRGHVLLSGGAWNGTMSTAIMVGINKDLTLGSGCDAFEGFGCWYQSYSSRSPGSYLPTDGAACVDYAHRVAVGTSIDAYDETQPGMANFFQYTEDLVMSAWLPADGGNLAAGGLPVSAVCH